MPNLTLVSVPISQFYHQPSPILEMAEAAPVLLTRHDEPAAILVSPQEWSRIINRLHQLEAIQEARQIIARNNVNQSWISSAEMRLRLRSRGADFDSTD